jgi:hypothetical protein
MTDLQELMALLEKACPGELIVDFDWHDFGGRFVSIRNKGWDEAVGSSGVAENDARAFAAAVNFLRSPAFAEMQRALQRVEPILYREAWSEDYAAIYPDKVRPISMTGIDTTERDGDAAASGGA